MVCVYSTYSLTQEQVDSVLYHSYMTLYVIVTDITTNGSQS
jgi:hypothetical protein